MTDPKKFYADKAALLTALLSSIDTCHRICGVLEALEATAPGGGDPDFLAVRQLLDDASAATEALRDATDALA